MKNIKLIEVPSEIGAGTRGASMGIDAIKIAALDFMSNFFVHFPSEDAFNDLVNVISEYNKIILGTPVYWYAMSSNMKVFFDRLTDLVTVKKEEGRKWRSKNVYLLAVGSDPQLPEGFEIPFRLTAQYFNMNYKACAYFCNKLPFKSESHIKTKHDFLTSFNSY